jgi:hypothetical protein
MPIVLFIIKWYFILMFACILWVAIGSIMLRDRKRKTISPEEWEERGRYLRAGGNWHDLERHMKRWNKAHRA